MFSPPTGENAMTPDFANMDRAALAAAYLERIGYDPFKDDPAISEDEVRQTLAEHAAEIEACEAA